MAEEATEGTAGERRSSHSSHSSGSSSGNGSGSSSGGGGGQSHGDAQQHDDAGEKSTGATTDAATVHEVPSAVDTVVLEAKATLLEEHDATATAAAPSDTTTGKAAPLPHWAREYLDDAQTLGER